MLGRFLEFSISTPDIRASLEFYGKLGFSHAEVGEAWNHAYAVVTDGRICLGLHQDGAPAPCLTFVKPELLKHLHSFEKLGLQFEFRHLGNHVFNQVGWLDPSGHLIRLVEARTFSPSKRDAIATSSCGYFLEVGLPTPDRETAKAYWEQFGFVGMDESDAPLPHVSCTSDTVDIGLYEPAHLQAPTLLFEVDDLNKSLSHLDAVGVAPARSSASLRHVPAAVFTAPEGTPILLMSAPGASALRRKPARYGDPH